MKASTKWIVVSLAVVLVAAVAVSQTVRRAHARWGERGFEQHLVGMMTDYLDLSHAQQAQVKQIFANEKPSILPLVQQLAESHKQLRQLEEGSTFDEGKVRTLASQQAQTMTDLIIEKAKIKSQIFNLLNADQKAKAQKFMDRHEARMQKHLQNMEQVPAQQ